MRSVSGVMFMTDSAFASALRKASVESRSALTVGVIEASGPPPPRWSVAEGSPDPVG